MNKLESLLKDKEIEGLLTVLSDLLIEKTGDRFVAKVKGNSISFVPNKGKYCLYNARENTYYTTGDSWSQDRSKMRLFAKKCDASNVFSFYMYRTHNFNLPITNHWHTFNVWLYREIGKCVYAEDVHLNYRGNYSDLSEHTLKLEFKQLYNQFCQIILSLNSVVTRLASEGQEEHE